MRQDECLRELAVTRAASPALANRLIRRLPSNIVRLLLLRAIDRLNTLEPPQ